LERKRSDMEVRFQGLTKLFGSQVAVDNIDFVAREGEILGFLGPNGAGKSTTMKIATGYLFPDGGTVTFDGRDILEMPVEIRNQIGYLPESNPLYLDMYVEEFLGYAGRFFGLKGKLLRSRIEKMIELTGLLPEKHKKIGALSKGFRQRTGLAQALIHDPTYLFLDEPTSGLDPNQILEIRDLIKTIGKEKTVILSTHIMQEVQAICKRVVIIDKGKIIANDLVEHLKTSGSKTKTLILEFSGIVNPQDLQKIDGVVELRKITESKFELDFPTGKEISERIFDAAKSQGWKILEMKEKEKTLESVFHQLTRN
jgi:gliding motility-associated transport system ATP-binding protein